MKKETSSTVIKLILNEIKKKNEEKLHIDTGISNNSVKHILVKYIDSEIAELLQAIVEIDSLGK
jgi:hypothetical protein